MLIRHRFKIEDARYAKDDLAAWACIRLDRLQQGYRFVYLLDAKGQATPGLLLMKIEKKLSPCKPTRSTLLVDDKPIVKKKSSGDIKDKPIIKKLSSLNIKGEKTERAQVDIKNRTSGVVTMTSLGVKDGSPVVEKSPEVVLEKETPVEVSGGIKNDAPVTEKGPEVGVKEEEHITTEMAAIDVKDDKPVVEKASESDTKDQAPLQATSGANVQDEKPLAEKTPDLPSKEEDGKDIAAPTI